MKYTISVLCVLCIFTFSNQVTAQADTLLTDNVNLDITPENPGPNQQVSATLSSYDTNIHAAHITWIVNGIKKKSGVGETSFSFITGSLNTTTRLLVEIETAEGQTVEKSLDLKPSSVDLLWQTESFTPPFYKGKPMFSFQNKITFIALPHITNSNGVEISTKNLIYTWKLNGSVVAAARGYGRNTYTVVGSIISRPLDVQVEVIGTNSEEMAVGNIVITPASPEIIFYKKSPLYGIEFQNALTGTISLQNSQDATEKSKEITIIGVPFFFGTTDSHSSDLSYTWSINGGKISSDGRQTTQVFRQIENMSGTSQITLSIENTNKILQSARDQFNLTFGQ